METQIPVEKAKGKLVQRKATSAKLYDAVGYCRYNRKYQLNDTTDISRAIYLKKGTLVWVV